MKKRGWDGSGSWFTWDNWFYQCGVTINVIVAILLLDHLFGIK